MNRPETSANFDLEDVAPFLKRVSSILDGGLDDDTVDRIQVSIENLAVNDEWTTSITVVYRGQPSQLEIDVFMDDVDAPDVSFGGTPP